MIEVNNLTSFKINKKFLRKTAQKVFAGEGKEKTELSIVLMTPAKIKELNRKYRKKNSSTDVLSYIYNKNAGEIVISPQVVKNNAKIFKSTFQKELTKVLIHSILHLLGYDHEDNRIKARKMETKQNYYFNSIIK